MDAAQTLRRKLNIPEDAERVLIFGESSHWDPNWLYTSEVYFERFVSRNLDQAIEALLREPRRVYSIECVFFLRMYWERRPEKRKPLRELLNSGRMRLTSPGVTTADTLLPRAEAILRDWLIGQEWLRERGIEQEPTLAYFADSFGASPNLPSLLRAAGFDRTAITRIDGMYFPGCELPLPGKFPRPGSSAHRLLKEERSLDFIWRDSNGADVLCHWNAFTYGQGDMLAYTGLSRVYLVRFALDRRSEQHIARRIRGYVKQLAPHSRTPYLFCPIGFDFVEPIPDLVALLDRYNRHRYPNTGVWVVNAGLDDYLALVETHREALPVLELDPNPYWTGFYTARPALKRRCHDLTGKLLLAEKLACLSGERDAREVVQPLAGPWWQAAVANHHDFITGTSPDAVVEEEQTPWLEEAEQQVDAVIEAFAPATLALREKEARGALPDWRQEGGRVQVRTQFYDLTWDEALGGAFTQVINRISGEELLRTGSGDLVSYRDSGGLWRMGYEFTGGTWKETQRASQRPASLQVRPLADGLEIISTCELQGERFRRRAWVSATSPLIHFLIEGKAAEGYSVIARFWPAISGQTLHMDAPGGVVARPLQRIYQPTLWPLHHFLHVQDEVTGRGLAVIQALPGAVSWSPDGRLELVVARNAAKETVFGLFGIPGHPARGIEKEPYAFHFALMVTRAGDWRQNRVHRLAWEMADGPWADARMAALRKMAHTVIAVDNDDVRVVAVKPAWRGRGIIVRLEAPQPLSIPVHVTVPGRAIARAWLCDARERDLAPLKVSPHGVQVAMAASILTLRIETEPAPLQPPPDT